MSDTPTPAQQFLTIALADLEAEGGTATRARVAELLGVPAQVLSQACTGTSPASTERLSTWCRRWAKSGRSRVRIVDDLGTVTLEVVPTCANG